MCVRKDSHLIIRLPIVVAGVILTVTIKIRIIPRVGEAVPIHLLAHLLSRYLIISAISPKSIVTHPISSGILRRLEAELIILFDFVQESLVHQIPDECLCEKCSCQSPAVHSFMTVHVACLTGYFRLLWFVRWFPSTAWLRVSFRGSFAALRGICQGCSRVSVALHYMLVCRRLINIR